MLAANDCDDNLVALYSASQRVVYGAIHQRGRTTYIGNPPAGIVRHLDRFWRSEWRRGR